MEIKINLDLDNENFKIDSIKFQKMLLLYNAIEEGWSIKKMSDSYVFKKNHEGKKEIMDEKYLLTFMKSNFDMSKIVK
jgi:hypothetical protein